MSGERDVDDALANVRAFFDALARLTQRCDTLPAPRIVREQARGMVGVLAFLAVTQNATLRSDVELVLDTLAANAQAFVDAATSESEVTTRFVVDADAETTEISQNGECP